MEPTGLLVPWDNDSWGLQGCQGDMMNKECHLDENSGPHSHGTVQSRAEPAMNAILPFFEVFPKFSVTQSGTLWKWNFTEELVVAWTYLIALLKHRVQLYTYARRLVPHRKGQTQTLNGKQGSTIVETGNCLFKTWPGFWTST